MAFQDKAAPLHGYQETLARKGVSRLFCSQPMMNRFRSSGTPGKITLNEVRIMGDLNLRAGYCYKVYGRFPFPKCYFFLLSNMFKG